MGRHKGDLFARFSLDYADHPKIQALSDAAFRAHVEMILYARRYLTDGRVPNRVANRFGFESVSELLHNDPERPSLTQDAHGDYWLHDFADMQETRAEVEAKRLVNSTNGRLGGRPRTQPKTHSVTDSVSERGSETKAETETETEIYISCSSDADASSKRPSIDDDFAAWWEHYPRKVGKGQAIKAYRRARKLADHDTLVAAIDQQAETLTARGKEFTPYPATWLNGQRWEDAPDLDQPEVDDWAPPPIMPRDLYGGTDEDYRIYVESMRR